MAENPKRYQCIMLGHNEPLIQSKLDKIGSDSRVVGVVSIGVNVLAIVERVPEYQVVEPVAPIPTDSQIRNRASALLAKLDSKRIK